MIGAILQVRTGSSRLPGKCLLPLRGMPMLVYILRRLRDRLPLLPIVVATTNLERDNVLVELCTEENVPWFRGSETDVLARFAECAQQMGFSQIIRLTADNPFTDLKELQRLIDLHTNAPHDYTHSVSHLPLGAGAEIFTLSCLLRAHREGLAAHHREHVNEYVLEHPELFTIHELEVSSEKRHPELYLTVDTPADYEQACQIVAAVEHPWVCTEDAIAWLLRSV